jgi:tRNA pseudouridine13 synthase
VKLKRLPEDFRVDEVVEIDPAPRGDFALYRLTKRGLGTLEAIDAIVRRWKLARTQVSHGGLKDRHAASTQHVTIHRGPRRDLHQTNFDLDYLSQFDRPFTSQAVSANRFRIVLRSMEQSAVAIAQQALDAVRRDGLPNYFDNQRFGSLGDSNEFVAAAWIAGDYERTVWLALADSNPRDRADDRALKRVLRDYWGDWGLCWEHLEPLKPHAAVRFLCERPGDFRGALARISHALRSLYVSAFQSYLWNRLLAAQIGRICPESERRPVMLKTGSVPFFNELSDESRSQLQAIQLPLPSARMKLDDGPIHDLVTRSLAELGLTIRAIRVKYPRDSFFSKGWRAAVFPVRDLNHEIAEDELYAKRQKLILRFELPRGCYATILVKQITRSNDAGDELNQDAFELDTI